MRRIWRLLLYVRPYALYSLASVVLMAVVGRWQRSGCC